MIKMVVKNFHNKQSQRRWKLYLGSITPEKTKTAPSATSSLEYEKDNTTHNIEYIIDGVIEKIGESPFTVKSRDNVFNSIKELRKHVKEEYDKAKLAQDKLQCLLLNANIKGELRKELRAIDIQLELFDPSLLKLSVSS